MSNFQGFDERIEHLLPAIFDDVKMKGWRDYNSNIDTSIVLEFLNEFFSPSEDDGVESAPPDVRILFSLQK